MLLEHPFLRDHGESSTVSQPVQGLSYASASRGSRLPSITGPAASSAAAASLAAAIAAPPPPRPAPSFANSITASSSGASSSTDRSPRRRANGGGVRRPEDDVDGGVDDGYDQDGETIEDADELGAGETEEEDEEDGDEEQEVNGYYDDDVASAAATAPVVLSGSGSRRARETLSGVSATRTAAAVGSVSRQAQCDMLHPPT